MYSKEGDRLSYLMQCLFIEIEVKEKVKLTRSGFRIEFFLNKKNSMQIRRKRVIP